MSEEELLVTPLARNKGSIENEVTDEGLFSSELLWFVHGVDLVQSRVGWNGRKLVNIGHVVIWLGLWEEGFDSAVWGESEREWERRISILSSGFVISGEIGEANFLDEVGGGREFGSKEVQCDTLGWSNMVGEVF